MFWSSMLSFHLLGQDDQDEIQHDLFGHMMPLAQHKHNVMPMSSLMAPMHLFSQDS